MGISCFGGRLIIAKDASLPNFEKCLFGDIKIEVLGKWPYRKVKSYHWNKTKSKPVSNDPQTVWAMTVL